MNTCVDPSIFIHALLTRFLKDYQLSASSQLGILTIFGKEWEEENATRSETARFIKKMKYLMHPAKEAERVSLRRVLTQTSSELFEKKSVTLDINKLLFVRTTKLPLLWSLAGDDRLNYVISFPKLYFSHYYIALRLDEFAQQFYSLLPSKKASTSTSSSMDIEPMSSESKELDYCIFSNELSVDVHTTTAVAVCFLCFLCIEFFELPKARFDFLYVYLPVSDNVLLCLVMLMSTLSSPKTVNSKDVELFRAFENNARHFLPSIHPISTGLLTESNKEYEDRLLLHLYMNQKHSHDISNTCRLHKFRLSEKEVKMQQLALSLVKEVKPEN